MQAETTVTLTLTGNEARILSEMLWYAASRKSFEELGYNLEEQIKFATEAHKVLRDAR